MNALTPFAIPSDRMLLRKNGTVGILERLCVVIEPTDTQKATAKERYEAVGRWMADAPQYIFSASRIATEVWVKAPGLITMPAAVSRASWIQSMISYSRLL